MTEHHVAEIESALRGKRFALQDEKELQGQIADALAAADIQFEREVRVSGGIIDFRTRSGVGIEIKIKGSMASVARQVHHYSEDPDITCLLVVTPRALVLPSEMSGKPVFQFNLAGAWL